MLTTIYFLCKYNININYICKTLWLSSETENFKIEIKFDEPYNFIYIFSQILIASSVQKKWQWK